MIKNQTNREKRLRAVVSRSNTAIYLQVVDDQEGKIIFAGSTKKIETKVSPTEKAKLLGLNIATLAKEKKIASLVFDRNGLRYHGRVKAVAEGIREGGIKI